MRSLRLAMRAVGIPNRWTSRLMDGLRIRSVEELGDLTPEAIMLVPTQFRQQIIDLRNLYAHDNVTHLYLSVDMV